MKLGEAGDSAFLQRLDALREEEPNPVFSGYGDSFKVMLAEVREELRNSDTIMTYHEGMADLRRQWAEKAQASRKVTDTTATSMRALAKLK